MGLIIHHWAARNLFRFSLAFFASVLLVLSPLGHAQGADKALDREIPKIINVLKDEIARDEVTTSSNMTSGHLRLFREKLAVDLSRKQNALAAVKQVKNSAIESAIQMLEDTNGAEAQIIADIRVNDVVQTRVLRALRDNLPKKKQALADFEKWVKANPSGGS